MGVTVPETVLTTNAVAPDAEMATAVGEYPTGMAAPGPPPVLAPGPTKARAVIGVTESESPPTTMTVLPSGVTASALGACPAGIGCPARPLATLIVVTVSEP